MPFLQICFPYQNDATYGSVVRHLHKRSPWIPGSKLTATKLAKLSALKGLFLVKAAGLGGAAVIGKKKAYKTIKVPKKWVTLPGR